MVWHVGLDALQRTHCDWHSEHASAGRPSLQFWVRDRATDVALPALGTYCNPRGGVRLVRTA